MDKAKGQLAEQRTDLSEDRTLLANERTFAGWIRTGLSCVGLGLGFQALFSRMHPDWTPRVIATIFMLIGISIFVAAERRAQRVRVRFDPHEVEALSTRHVRMVTVGLVMATLLLVGAMWLLEIEPRPTG